jgi:type I restriction enzyme S subunit
MAGEVEEIRVIDFEIPNHWERATFRQLLKDGSLELVQDGNHGGAYPKPEEFAPTGIPIITGADLNAGVIDLRGCKFLKPASAARLRIGYAKQGDVLLTHKGTMGKTAIVPSLPWPYIILNPQITLYRVSRDGRLHGRFLKFFFDSKPFQAFLERISGISTISTLSLTVQKSLEIPLPPLGEQKAIAAVLGALDDKIESNRRMNATLEAMAQALFQSWFVDFDPVRAKLDGRQPVGLDPDAASRFPDSFQDSEVGHIPKGWTVRPLSSHACYLSRGFGPSYLEKGGVCVLNQKCVRDHRVDYSKSRRHDSVKKPINGRVLQTYDVLVNSTGMGTLGRVAQAFHLPEETIVDSHVTIVRAEVDTDALFLGINLTSREAEIEELGEGSTGQTELSRARLGELKIIAPPLDLQKAFGVTVRPLLMRISENESQSRTLATLRDTLLPKLLSGDLSVMEFEKEVSA